MELLYNEIFDLRDFSVDTVHTNTKLSSFFQRSNIKSSLLKSQYPYGLLLYYCFV